MSKIQKFFMFALLLLIAVFSGISAFRDQPVVEKVIDVQSHVVFSDGIPVSVDLSGQPPIVIEQSKSSVESVVDPDKFAVVQLPDDPQVIVPLTYYEIGENDTIPMDLLPLGGYTEEGLARHKEYVENEHPANQDREDGEALLVLLELLKFGYDWTSYTYTAAGPECREPADLTVWNIGEVRTCLNVARFMSYQGTSVASYVESGNYISNCAGARVSYADGNPDVTTCAYPFAGEVYLYLANNSGNFHLGIHDRDEGPLGLAELVYIVLPLEPQK